MPQALRLNLTLTETTHPTIGLISDAVTHPVSTAKARLYTQKYIGTCLTAFLSYLSAHILRLFSSIQGSKVIQSTHNVNPTDDAQ